MTTGKQTTQGKKVLGSLIAHMSASEDAAEFLALAETPAGQAELMRISELVAATVRIYHSADPYAEGRKIADEMGISL